MSHLYFSAIFSSLEVRSLVYTLVSLQYILMSVPQIDEPNAFGNTALHVACYTGQEAVANELVNRGANVNQPNHRGYTPLHLAAVSTNGALCLELLVNNGADVNMQVWFAKVNLVILLLLFFNNVPQDFWFQ